VHSDAIAKLRCRLFGFAVLVLSVITGASQASASITFADILRAPDDPELNLRYAEERIAQSDLNAALSALERVIAAEPLNIRARLLRAQILVELDNQILAMGEVNALLALPLEDSVRNEVVRLSKMIANANVRWNRSLILGLAVFGSDNVNAFPNSGQFESANGALGDYTDVAGNALAVSDQSAEQSIQVQFDYDVGSQSRDHLKIDLAGTRVTGDDSQFLRNDTSRVRLSWERSLFSGTWTASAAERRLQQVRSNDMTQRTYFMSYSTPVSESISTSVDVMRSHADYRGSTNADESDARMTQGRLRLNKQLGTRWLLGTTFEYAERRAKIETSDARAAADRDSKTVGLDLVYVLDQTQFIRASQRITHDDYLTKDANYPRIRDDRRLISSLQYSRSLDGLFSGVDGVRMFGAVSSARTHSNLRVFETEAETYSIGLTYETDF